MKVLVADGISPKGKEILVNAGLEVVEQFYPPEELEANIKDFDAIIVRSATKVRKNVIDASNLKVIARAGVGMDNIDVEYAREQGIKVLNTPGASSVSVAELAIGHMFSIARFLNISKEAMSNLEWPKKSYSKGWELTGKTLGVMGLGAIGREVAKRGRGLGMNVIGYNKFHQINDQGIEMVERDELLAKADVVTLHIPLADDKSPEITANCISKMKDGAVLINCARGGVVDEAALLEALNSGKLSGAGVDVFVDEPITEAQKELLNHSAVSVSPHIGASTKEAQIRVGLEIAERVVKGLQG